MPVVARINKSGLSSGQKRQLRRALSEKANIQVIDTAITSKATLGTTLTNIVSGTTTDPIYLNFPVKAGKTYLVRAQLEVTHTDNNGSKVGFTGPTATFLQGLVTGPLIGATRAVYDEFTDVSSEAAAGAQTANYAVFEFTYKPSADGNLKAQWAEQTSHADTLILKAGSFVKVEEV